MVEQLQQAKLVLLGEMGSGKTSLVQRYVRGHYYENQVRTTDESLGPTTRTAPGFAAATGRRVDLARPSGATVPHASALTSLLFGCAGIDHRRLLFHQDHPRETREI